MRFGARFVALLLGCCVSVGARAGPVLTEVVETMMEAQAGTALFIGRIFGAVDASTLHFASNVDPIGRAFSYATLPNQSFGGSELVVASSGAFDSASGRYLWTSSGHLGARPWTSTGSVEWVGDPTGSVTDNWSVSDGLGGSGSINFTLKRTVEYNVLLGTSTGTYKFNVEGFTNTVAGTDTYDFGLGRWTHTIGPPFRPPGVCPLPICTFSEGFFASPADGGIGGFDMSIQSGPALIPEPPTLPLMALAMLFAAAFGARRPSHR